MSWPKPTVIDPLEAPKALHLGRWLFFFILLILITGIVLALMWPDKNSFLQWTFWLSIAFISAAIGSIAVSVRFYLYGLAQEEYEIWQLEQKQIEQNWQEWAMQSLIVLNSFYALPSKISIDDIMENSQNLTSHANKPLIFNDDFDMAGCVESLFSSMQDVLSLLSPKEFINIIVYSSPESYGLSEKDIDVAYKNAKIKQPYTMSYQIMSQVDTDKLIERIESPQSSIQLIIINNTGSSGSAFICAFLFTDKKYYQDLAIDIGKNEILRPMITQDMPIGIQQMAEMQSVIHQVKQLWFSNLDKKQEVNVAKQLAEWDISPELMYHLENIAGNQTELSYWLSLVLACEMVTKTKQNNLIAAMNHNQWLFSVVTTIDRES
ncbi:hypothetical protein [Gilliamella sp. WF3-4]|jgi:hypothetical protein|uniref:hypothetical protein n=1 Tax=Gilliamella sp. WF3-4 TaxID=3120255 RepID=UPI00080DDC6D|nr:hypothetical protein [Gilliamella apicola]OCG16474.1 hypothetical protein A9G47_10975 [Gilliamella apicola]